MLDEFRSTSITWDKATSRIYSPVTANASDENGRKLVVQIVNSGQVEDLTGATLHLYWETRDKAHDGLDVFDAVDLKKGEFELSYTTGMLSNHGVLNANLVLIDTVGRVVSERFKITVTEGIDNDAIQSENSFSSLTQALIDVSNLEQSYTPRLNDLTAQLQQTKQELSSQLAQKAEQTALETEKARIDNLISLPEGATTNDARLEDIAIGQDGTVYDSPGEAVRTQFETITNQTLTLKNRITNGDFAQGTENWGTYNSTIEVIDGVMKVTPTGNQSQIRQAHNVPTGHLAYWRALVKGENIQIADNGVTMVSWESFADYGVLSGVENPNTSPLFQLRRVATTSRSPFYVDKVMLIDLTESFGPGNEPTKEEMDTLVKTLPQQWWDDVLNVQRDLVFNWLVKLNREKADYYNVYTKSETDTKLAETSSDINNTLKNQDDVLSAIETLKQAQAGAVHTITIDVPNDTGEVIEDATVRLALHKGSQQGKVLWNEVFSQNFKNAFGNVRPYDANGNLLEYDLHAHGNYDFIVDDSINPNYGILAFSDGTLATSNGGELKTSVDGGTTWVGTGLTCSMVAFIDSQDRIFLRTANAIATMYSKDNWTNGTVVMDFTIDGEDVMMQQMRWAEDRIGNIYYGKYQPSWGASIWKMNSGQSTFVRVYENADYQHTHRIFCDTSGDTDVIYAGLDNSTTRPLAIRSLDYGTTWEELPIPYNNRDYGLIGNYGGVLYGSGEASALGGMSLYATTDPTDSSAYYGAIDTVQLIRRVDNPKGDILIALGGASFTNKIEQIYMSKDNGSTWVTAYANDLQQLTTDVGDGVTSFSTGYIQPRGLTEKQSILSGVNRDYFLRAYFGGDRYYGLMYVNVGDIPVEGKQIKLETDFILTTSDEEKTYSEMLNEPIMYAALDEGEGTQTKINGTLTDIVGMNKWNKVETASHNGIVGNKINRNSIALNSNGYVDMGGIPIEKNKDISFSFMLDAMPGLDGINIANREKNIILFASNNSTENIIIQLSTTNQLSLLYNGVSISVLNIQTPYVRMPKNTAITFTVTISNDVNPVVTLYQNGGLKNTANMSTDGFGKALSEYASFTIGKKSYASNQEANAYGMSKFKVYDKCLSEREVLAEHYARNYLTLS